MKNRTRVWRNIYRLKQALWFRREMEFALGHRRLRMQRAPVTYSVQFQNGGFSLSDLIYISHSFVEFSKNCAGILWILRCVALWPFLRVELVCFSLCNDSKIPKFGPSEFIQYSGI